MASAIEVAASAIFDVLEAAVEAVVAPGGAVSDFCVIVGVSVGVMVV